MERSDWLAITFLLAVTILGALSAGAAVLFGRSQTLANVRDVDLRLIESLIRPLTAHPPSEDATRAIDEALDVLIRRSNRRPYIGLSVFYNGDVVATNYETVELASLAARNTTGTVHTTDLSGGWQLAAERFEQKYDFNAWHAFISVPVQQFRDGSDVTWDAIQRKATMPALVTAGVGLLLVGIYVAMTLISRRRIQWLERSLAENERVLHDKDAKLAEKEQAIRESAAARTALEERIALAAQRHADLSTEWQKSRELTEREKQKLADDFRASEELLAGLNNDMEQHRKAIDGLKREQEEIRAELSEKDAENRRLRAELEERSDRAASKTETEKKMLDRIWHVEWHDEARGEAHEMYRSGQPSSRWRLTDLLARSIADLPPGSAGAWEPMKPKAPQVLHNAHRDQAKLYWFKSSGNRPCILAVSGGSDDHQRFDGGETLHRRFQTVQAKMQATDRRQGGR